MNDILLSCFSNKYLNKCLTFLVNKQKEENLNRPTDNIQNQSPYLWYYFYNNLTCLIYITQQQIYHYSLSLKFTKQCTLNYFKNFNSVIWITHVKSHGFPQISSVIVIKTGATLGCQPSSLASSPEACSIWVFQTFLRDMTSKVSQAGLELLILLLPPPSANPYM